MPLAESESDWFSLATCCSASRVQDIPPCQEIAEITQKLTKFSTLDYEEYMRFMRASWLLLSPADILIRLTGFDLH